MEYTWLCVLIFHSLFLKQFSYGQWRRRRRRRRPLNTSFLFILCPRPAQHFVINYYIVHDYWQSQFSLFIYIKFYHFSSHSLKPFIFCKKSFSSRLVDENITKTSCSVRCGILLVDSFLCIFLFFYVSKSFEFILHLSCFFFFSNSLHFRHLPNNFVNIHMNKQLEKDQKENMLAFTRQNDLYWIKKKIYRTRAFLKCLILLLKKIPRSKYEFWICIIETKRNKKITDQKLTTKKLFFVYLKTNIFHIKLLNVNDLLAL